MMNNFADSTKMATDAINSQGLAEKKNDVYLDSIQAKLTVLGNEMKSVFQQGINSNIFKDLIDGANGLVKTFGNFHTILAQIITVTLLFKGNSILNFFKELPNNIDKSIGNMKLFQEISRGLVLQEEGIISSTELTANSFKALGDSIKGLFLSNPLGWIAIGLTSIISIIDVYNQKQEEEKQKQEELKQQISSIADETEKEANSVRELNALLDEQKQIQSKSEADRTVEEKQKLEQVEISLAEAIPSATTAYNSENKALAENYDLTKQLVALKKEEADNKAFDVVNSIDAQGDLDKIKKVKSQMDEINKLMNSIKGNYKDSLTNNNVRQLEELQRNSFFTPEQEKKLYGVSSIGELRKALASMHADLSKEVSQDSQELNKYNQAAEWYNSLGKQQFQIITDNSLGLGSNTSATDKNTDSSNSNTSSTESNTDAKTANTQANTDNSNSQEDQEKKLKDLASSFDTATKNAQFYTKTLNELKTKGKLSDDSVSEIGKSYPELLNYIGDRDALEKKLQQDIEQEKQVQLSALLQEKQETYNTMSAEEKAEADKVNAKLQVDTQYYNKNILANSTLVNKFKDEYNIDLNNYKSLAEAKSAINTKLLQSIMGSWAKFYDVQEDEFDYLSAGIEKFNSEGELDKYSQRAMENVDNRIQRYKDAVGNLNSEFSSITLGGSNLNLDSINMGSITSEELKDAEKAQEEYVSTVTKLRSDLANALKAQLEEQKQAELDALAKEKKAVEDKYDAEIDLINQKKEALQDQEDQEDKAEALNKEKQKLADLQAQYNNLLLAGNSSQAERDALKKQIDEEQQAINDMIRKNNVDAQTKNLDDQQKQLEAQKKLDDDNFTQRQTDIENKYKSLLSDAQVYADANKMIVEQNMQAIEDILIKYGNKFADYGTAMGKSLSQGIHDYVANGISAYNSLNGGGGSYSSGSSSSSSSSGRTYTVQAGDTLWAIARKLGTTVDHLVSANGISNPDVISIGQVLHYADGTLNAKAGLAEVNERGTELRVLGNYDGIVTADITKNINLLGENVPNILSAINRISLPKLPNISNIHNNSNPIKIDISNEFNVQGGLDEKALPKIQRDISNYTVNTIVEKLKQNGIQVY